MHRKTVRLVELVDTVDLKSTPFMGAGSSPAANKKD